MLIIGVLVMAAIILIPMFMLLKTKRINRIFRNFLYWAALILVPIIIIFLMGSGMHAGMIVILVFIFGLILFIFSSKNK